MNRKGKVFSLIAINGAMLFSFAIYGKAFSDVLSAKATTGNQVVEDVIDFDGSKLKVSTVEGNYVCRSQTKQGDYVYLINKSVKAPDSGAVANIRSMYEDDKSLSTIKFAKDSKNTEPYVFQNLKGISMVSNTRLSNIMVKTSDDGVNYHDLESLVVNTYDDSLNAYTGSLVFSEIVRDSYFMFEQVSEPVLSANIKRLVLSYSCDNNYIPPVKHSISTAPTENGSVNIDTTRKHVKGETVNFSVQPASGYIVSDVYTVPETTLSVSGFNYSFEMPENDVSIHASFELAPLIAYNVSAQASSGGSVSFSRTQYYENESVAFTVTPNSTYEIDSVSTSPSLAVSGSAGSYSFTMPASDVEVAVSYKQVSSLSFSGEYQIEFGVGDTFNHDNLVVTANYVDGSSKVVTDYSISTPDMSTAGSKTITVTYNGVSNTYQINVTAPDAIERIEISGTYKTNYHFNDTVDHTGVVVKAVYTSGNKVDVTSDCTFTDPSMSSWTILGKKVTVHYLTFSATYNIKIFTLNSISLSGQYSSTNTTFNYGDEYSLKGITAEATYKCTYDGGTDTMYEDVTSQVTCSGYNMSSVSNSQTVTVRYDDGHDYKTATYTIKVNDYIDGITYSAGGNAKTTYIVNEWFDKTGFTIYGEKASGATHTDVTSLATFETVQFTEAGTYNVRVSYPGVDDIFIPVTVEEPVTYLLTINQPSNGSIVGTPGSYQAGTTINLTVTANEGYEIKEVYYNDHVAISRTGSSYSFEMPACAVYINARIEQQSSEKTLYEVLSETKFDGNYPSYNWTGSFEFAIDSGNNILIQTLNNTTRSTTAKYGCDYQLVQKSGNLFTVVCSNIHDIVSKSFMNPKLANMSLFEIEFSSDLQTVVNIFYKTSYGNEFNWQK